MTAVFLLLLSLATLSPAPAREQLVRHQPKLDNIEQEAGFTLYEKGIPRESVDRVLRYLAGRFPGDELRIVVMTRMPRTSDLYFLEVQRVQENDERNYFLVLKQSGEAFSEVTRAENDITCGILEPTFFAGKDRVLIIISISAFDGGYCGNFPLEYTNGRIRALGDIPVYDGVHGPGGWQGHSPIERATAQYSNGTYYVTMRGRGSLYEGEKTRVARRGVPVTYVFKNGTFERIRTRGTRR